MSKRLLPLLLFLVLVSCSKNTSDGEDGIEDSSLKIELSEIASLVETSTTLRVSVSGSDEQIRTSIIINDSEAFSTTQKDFDFELNPFDYPNGKTRLTVMSTGTGNLESTQDEEFEIKKLLFRSYGWLSSEFVDSYLAINLQSTGELVAFKKIITYDDPIFFHAKDNFIEEDIIITQYVLSNSENGFYLAQSYADVKPGTELVSSQEVASQLGLDLLPINKNSTLDVVIEGNAFSGLFSALGRDYSFGSSTFPNLTFDYDNEKTTDIFLYYMNQASENIFEDYRYSYIENLTNQTIQFDEMSMVDIENIATLDLPSSVEKARITLLGYSSEKNYKEGMFRLLFGYGRETETSDYTLSYPILQEYPIIEKSINLDLVDGRKVQLEQREIAEIKIPDFSIQEANDTIIIDGEYDFASLELDIKHPDPQNTSLFRRIYRSEYKNSIKIPFKELEIPDEIVQILNQQGFNIGSKDDSGELELILSEFGENTVFPNGVFYFPLRKENSDAFTVFIPL